MRYGDFVSVIQIVACSMGHNFGKHEILSYIILMITIAYSTANVYGNTDTTLVQVMRVV